MSCSSAPGSIRTQLAAPRRACPPCRKARARDRQPARAAAASSAASSSVSAQPLATSSSCARRVARVSGRRRERSAARAWRRLGGRAVRGARDGAAHLTQRGRGEEGLAEGAHHQLGEAARRQTDKLEARDERHGARAAERAREHVERRAQRHLPVLRDLARCLYLEPAHLQARAALQALSDAQDGCRSRATERDVAQPVERPRLLQRDRSLAEVLWVEPRAGTLVQVDARVAHHERQHQLARRARRLHVPIGHLNRAHLLRSLATNWLPDP